MNFLRNLLKTTGGKLDAVGAALVVVASFLPWTSLGRDHAFARSGMMLSLSVFYNWDAVLLADSFLISAGMLMVLLGIASVIGVFLHWPLLTWLAGGLVVVGLGMLVISLVRQLDFGLLLGLAGGIAILVGAFLDRNAPRAST